MLTILVVLIVAGLLLWGVQQLPIDATIVRIIRAVVIVALVFWLLSFVAPLPHWLRLR